MLDISNAEQYVVDNNIKNITKSQIRKFLAAVNKISNMVKLSNDEELNDDILDEIKYMQIQFAYIVGKNNKNNEVKKLYEELKKEMNNLKTKKDFINFARYIEAIVAYHKFHGGKEQ